MKTLASVDLIKAVISMRSIKEKVEIAEIEKAVGDCIRYACHSNENVQSRVSRNKTIFGTIEGIALAKEEVLHSLLFLALTDKHSITILMETF